MKIPKEFKLGGIKWRVKIKRLDGEVYGTCYPNTATIEIEKRLSPQLRESTFCHEFVHAAMFSMGIQDHDEKFVEGFAVFLYQYLTQLE